MTRTALRGDLNGRLADACGLLVRLQTTVGEGRAAHEELLVKIASPSAPPALELREDLDGELRQIAALAGSGRWREAHRRLDRWTADTRTRLDEAERILSANRAPIEARNQFGALLEAYQVKAGRLGRIEDSALEGIFAQAHQALYTAPTDLGLVAQLVRRYQELLGAGRTEPEAVR